MQSAHDLFIVVIVRFCSYCSEQPEPEPELTHAGNILPAHMEIGQKR